MREFTDETAAEVWAFTSIWRRELSHRETPTTINNTSEKGKAVGPA